MLKHTQKGTNPAVIYSFFYLGIGNLLPLDLITHVTHKGYSGECNESGICVP